MNAEEFFDYDQNQIPAPESSTANVELYDYQDEGLAYSKEEMIAFAEGYHKQAAKESHKEYKNKISDVIFEELNSYVYKDVNQSGLKLMIIDVSDLPTIIANIKDKIDSRASKLFNALIEISKGEGRYDPDKLKHASNAVEDMTNLAKAAIAEYEFDNISESEDAIHP